MFEQSGRTDPRRPAPIDVKGFAALGVTVKPRNQDQELFELWDINRATVELFSLVSTQWRTVTGAYGGTRYVGLDYVAVDVVMRRSAIADENGKLFAGLMAMEDGALAAFAELGAA